ncbi:unnamed protein product [Rotaria sordida]|uniref:F-box domain-containing protein n=1 Tax=Rotaria sordida TaxID=392033 RepID=A0A818WJV6_9BILA|nr:unnamed protein product [Rotaria sordida]
MNIIVTSFHLELRDERNRLEKEIFNTTNTSAPVETSSTLQNSHRQTSTHDTSRRSSASSITSLIQSPRSSLDEITTKTIHSTGPLRALATDPLTTTKPRLSIDRKVSTISTTTAGKSTTPVLVRLGSIKQQDLLKQYPSLTTTATNTTKPTKTRENSTTRKHNKPALLLDNYRLPRKKLFINRNYDKMTKNLISKFENLSNELLFNIFEYLNGEKLFNAFHNLNYRINRILNDDRLLMNIVFNRISTMESVCNMNQIQFLNVGSSNSYFSWIATDLQKCSIMPRASRLSINSPYTPDLIVGLVYIKSRMPNLIHVTVKIDEFLAPAGHHIEFLIEGLLDLSHIRRFSLKLTYHTSEIVYTNFTGRKKAPYLEHLSIIGCNISLLSIIDLITNSPNLYSLEMKIQKHVPCPDFSVFQQITKATLKFVGFNNDNFQDFFSSMTRLISLRLDDETLISTARLYVSNTVHISKASVGYFNYR